MQKRPFKDIHIKAIKLLKSGMTEFKVAETLCKSRGWVQTIKRSPAYQEVFDSINISDVLINNPPTEDDFEAIVEDIAEQILEPEPEIIIHKIQRGEPRSEWSEERLECLTQCQEINQHRRTVKKIASTTLAICENLQEILKIKIESLSPEEISPRNIAQYMKVLNDSVAFSSEMLSRSLGIEKLQEVLKDELEIKEDELEFIDV